MKKNYYIAMWLLTCFCWSCNSFLEEMPQNKLKPSTVEDYGQLLNKGYISKQVLPWLDVLSDDIDLIESNKPFEGDIAGDIYVGAYMWNSNIETTIPDGDKAFETFYNSIFYANIVIENVANATASSSDIGQDATTRKNLLGEALALRAYSYFYLVNLYAKPYDPQTCASDAGVPLNLSIEVKDYPYTRSSVKVVYNQIVEDLKEGVRLMEENPVEKGTKIRFNTIAAKALLARVYLYMQEWELAITVGEEVIAENPKLFDLRSAGENEQIYSDSPIEYNSREIIGKDYLAIDNDNVLFVNGLTENIPILCPEPALTTFSINEDLLAQYENGDVRKYYFMRRISHSYTNREKLIFTKNRFIDYPWGNMVLEVNATTGYSRVIRTEEVYLTLAEAYAHITGGIPTAIARLNTLREMKFKESEYKELKETDFSREDLIQKIWQERRLELCFEGHRWFDLRRTTRPAMERVGYKNQKASLLRDDPRYVLQIPQRELDVNPEIGINPR